MYGYNLEAWLSVRLSFSIVAAGDNAGSTACRSESHLQVLRSCILEGNSEKVWQAGGEVNTKNWCLRFQESCGKQAWFCLSECLPNLLRIALQDATPENLKVALTSAGSGSSVV